MHSVGIQGGTQVKGCSWRSGAPGSIHTGGEKEGKQGECLWQKEVHFLKTS